MTDKEKIKELWNRLEKWLRSHVSESLDDLNGPAEEAEIYEVERRIGIQFPIAFRESLMIHNGQKGIGARLIMPEGSLLLPISNILDFWLIENEIASQMVESDEPTAWRAEIENGVIMVKGNVKPLFRHPKRIPFADDNADILTYLDYNPPKEGNPGQVIKIWAEACSWQVLAPTFLDFFSKYIDELEQSKYKISAQYPYTEHITNGEK